jgi:DNA modification methylase
MEDRKTDDRGYCGNLKDRIMMNEIFNSDCIEGMRTLPDQSVNCCVTSPPYFGLRDYGHDGQIGLEDTPEQFVAKLVDVFREVKRVLKDDGTLWLNLGDSYNGSGQSPYATNMGVKKTARIYENTKAVNIVGLKPKDLIGIPWMVAFALRADGWYLRQDIIWHKPNPMPESVTDRCTKSHEYIFLLSKSKKYYYDHEAIKEPANYPNVVGMDETGFKDPKTFNGKHKESSITGKRKDYDKKQAGGGSGVMGYSGALKSNGTALYGETRNKRSVWTVTTKPYSEAHFATYPEDLIVDCIKAGCPEGGTVLDPFMGAGTTALVARKLNRQYVGFELNPEYIRIAKNRLQSQLGMFV